MYQAILDLLVQAVGAVQGTVMYTTLEVVSTIAVLFIIAIPFIVVYKVIQFITGR